MRLPSGCITSFGYAAQTSNRLPALQGTTKMPLAADQPHRVPKQCSKSSAMQNGDAAERKYAPATFEAAGLAVAGLLRLLAAGGFYAEEALAPGLAIAEQAAIELPRCAVS